MPLNDDSIGDRFWHHAGSSNGNNNHGVDPPVNPIENLYEQIRRFRARPLCLFHAFNRPAVFRRQPESISRGFEFLLHEAREELENTHRIDASILFKIELMVDIYETFDRMLPRIPPEQYTPRNLRWFLHFNECVRRFEVELDVFCGLIYSSEGGRECLRSRIQILNAFGEASADSASDDQTAASPPTNIG